MAEYSLGQALELTKPEASIAHLRRAVELTKEAAAGRLEAMPDWYPEAYVGLGTALLMKARQEPDLTTRAAVIRDAQEQLVAALKIDPNAPHAMNNLAFAQVMLAQASTSTPARSEYDLAIDLGVKLLNENDLAGAIAAFRRAVDLQPHSAAARVYLALALLRAHRADAVAALRAAKAIDAKKANDYITKALRMPPAPDNIDMVITQAAGQ